MAADNIPCRTALAAYPDNRWWRRRGSLLLYADKLAFVGSGLSTVGAAFGLVGVLVTQSIAGARAPGAVASGRKSVHVILRSEITSVKPVLSRRGKTKGLRVSTRDGNYRFIVGKADDWIADMARTNVSWYPIVGSALV